tara:strand:- start:5 stop:565 length:561 start_codon:yes stop_codon:yes gene_type:complete
MGDIDIARKAGWVFSGTGRTYSSGCASVRAQISEARSFNESRYAAQVAAQAAKIENARLAEIARLSEIARLELIARNDQLALEIWTNIDNQRIAKQQAEIKRLELVAQAQIQADINAENLRIKLLKEEDELQRIEQLNKIQMAKDKIQMDKDKETQRIEKAIPLLSSIIPISAIGLLLLYSSKGKK